MTEQKEKTADEVQLKEQSNVIEHTLKILDETKKAVQMGTGNQSLNSGFVHVVEIDGEIYVVHIDKYRPANQLIKKNVSLLTKM